MLSFPVSFPPSLLLVLVTTAFILALIYSCKLFRGSLTYPLIATPSTATFVDSSVNTDLVLHRGSEPLHFEDYVRILPDLAPCTNCLNIPRHVVNTHECLFTPTSRKFTKTKKTGSFTFNNQTYRVSDKLFSAAIGDVKLKLRFLERSGYHNQVEFSRIACASFQSSYGSRIGLHATSISAASTGLECLFHEEPGVLEAFLDYYENLKQQQQLSNTLN